MRTSTILPVLILITTPSIPSPAHAQAQKPAASAGRPGLPDDVRRQFLDEERRGVRGRTSYVPVAITEDFPAIMARMVQAKPEILKRQQRLLEERYDLSNRPAPGVTMSRSKPVQEGVRVRLPKGVTWEQLAAMSPEEIRKKKLFPLGFLPLPHVNHPEGGMVFPKNHIQEVLRQTGRDLERFDLDFDLPEHF